MTIKTKTVGQVPTALQYGYNFTKLGWECFAAELKLDPDTGKKHIRPRVAWKYGEGATCDPVRLERQFRDGDAICIATGPSRLGVIDTDKKGDIDGEVALFCLEMEYGPLPKHLKVQTASGTIHRIMRDRRSRLKSGQGDLAPGIDTRGCGGMIIAAGTQVVAPNEKWKYKAGTYRFLNLADFGITSIEQLDINDLGEIPDWVVELAGDPSLDAPRGRKKLRNPKPTKKGEIPEPVFVAAYTTEQFREALNLLDADKFDAYDDYCDIMLACTHATTVHDGKEVFLNWCTKNGTGKFAKDRPQIEYQWDQNLRKRNMEGGLAVGTFNWLLRNAGFGDSDKIKWPPDDFGGDPLTLGQIELLKIKKKIKKLLNKAKRKKDEAAAVKAAALMKEHGLTEDDLDTAAAPSGSFDDFIAYLPEHKYIFKATGALWPPATINSILGANATNVLDNVNPAHCMTWAPGLPTLITDRVRDKAGWIGAEGKCTFNDFRMPPVFAGGDPALAQPWLDHIARLFPVGSVEYSHLIKVFAYRVRYPGEKVNYAIILGSDDQGIGKDSLLTPIETLLGEWNVADVSASLVMQDKYNPYLKSLLCKINEADDLGDADRFAFYNRRKTWSVAPPKHLDVRQMYTGLCYVDNVVLLIISSNNKAGLFLPPEDRRNFVAWSSRVRTDFELGYFKRLHDWYSEPGTAHHIAAYLASVDLSDFDPKATPPETDAWRDIVGANRTTEASLVGDLVASLDPFDTPAVFTVDELRKAAARDLSRFGDLHDLLNHTGKAKILSHRLNEAGYSPVRNPDVKDGRWSTGFRDVVVYGRKHGMVERERLDAALAHANVLADQSRAERKAAREAKKANKFH
jgi:hypothetical protein